jgi:hypothetical protein
MHTETTGSSLSLSAAVAQGSLRKISFRGNRVFICSESKGKTLLRVLGAASGGTDFRTLLVEYSLSFSPSAITLDPDFMYVTVVADSGRMAKLPLSA